MLPAEAIGLLAQIPLVGIFVWFTLTLLKQNSSERTQRDFEWRTFLKEWNDGQLKAIGDLTSEIKGLGQGLTASIGELRSDMEKHDHRVDVHMATFQEKLTAMAGQKSRAPKVQID